MSNSEFKRTHFFRPNNGVEVKIQIPESVWQERIAPYLLGRTHLPTFDTLYGEIIMEALDLKIAGWKTD